MGYNTTVIILNDAIGELKNHSKEFTDDLYSSILRVNSNGMQDVAIGHNVNGASVIETHHADGLSLIAVGGNTAVVVSRYIGSYKILGMQNTKEQILRNLADELGYRVVKKQKRS